jgi:ribosomal protein S18 acetylase RimI-like enzyme
MIIRPFRDNDIEQVVTLSLLAWERVFQSFEQVLGSEIYLRIYPDWKIGQRKAVEDLCNDARNETWVAEENGIVVGFILWEINQVDHSAEVEMLAVHPDYQNRGIGTELNAFALAKLKDAGVTVVAVATGGDPGHAPARRSYEKAGYTPLPLVRYYKAL